MSLHPSGGPRWRGSGTGAIAVIGAGIVGLSTALQLQREGRRVVVVDRQPPMQACSAGNAGYLSEANIFPPLSADMLKQLPKLLVDGSGPLRIRPGYLGAMVPWARRAFATLKPDRHQVVTDTLAAMTRGAYAHFEDLARHAKAGHFLSRDGGIVAFKTRAALEKGGSQLPVWNAYGLHARRISADEIHQLEPALAPDIVGGILFENAGRCSNPQQVGLVYADAFAGHGGTVVQAEVRDIQPRPGGFTLATDDRPIDVAQVVVSAGYWSGSLMRRLGYRVPIVAERGYHMMLPKAGVRLGRPIVFGEPYFAATPMQDGLRLAGTAEFADADSAPDMRRATMLVRLAQNYLVGLGPHEGVPWMGVRPTLPDGMPAIGQAVRHPGLFYCFGHAHNGLTLSATSALCVSALVQGGKAPLDLAPLRLERFA